jgi:hypothetical protein
MQLGNDVWEQSGLSIAANGGNRSFAGVPEGAYTALVYITNPDPVIASNIRIAAGKTTIVTVAGDGDDTTCTAGAPQ